MTTNGNGQRLDFGPLIEERTRYFAGREWLFRRLAEWLADPTGGRVFLVTGGPGSGKTAVSARIALASLGGPGLPGCPSLRPGFLSYYHFCQAGRETTLAPMEFVRALSEALANRYPTFRAALLDEGSQRGHISGTAHAGAVAAGGQVIGVYIEGNVHIQIHGDDARSMFDEAVRRPLARHALECADPIIVLVDSLDEAFTFGKDRNIPQLLQLVNDFPPQVRFLLSCRTHNERVFRLVGPGTVDLTRDSPPNLDDVRPYAQRRLESLPDPPRTPLADKVTEKSRGNFMYAYYVLHDLLQHPPSPDQPIDIEMPDQLEGVYRRLLERELAADPSRWSEVYRPLLGAIAVARGDGLTKAQLLGITRLAADAIDDVLAGCREYLAGGDSPDRPYRIYHHSFREFLLEDAVYHVYPSERHAAIATMLLDQHGKAWKKCQDGYALRHAVLHLAESARSPGPEQDARLRQLVELTGNQWFQRRCDTFLHDSTVLYDHVLRTVAACAWSDRDDMLPWLVRAALAVTAYRENFLAGESVSTRARQGRVADAQSRLPLFGTLDRDWQTAASLIIAWLGAEQAPDAARQLVDRVAPAAITVPLPLLLARTRAALAGTVEYAYEAGPAESPEVCEALVRRLAGRSFNSELLVSRGDGGPGNLQEQTQVIAAQGYAARLDGPVLVNSARASGAAGTVQVDGYIDAHAGYTYVEYRNRSLWVLLEAVLRHHPDQQWVRARLERILHTVLMHGGAEFKESAPLVTAALHTQAHGGSAAAVIEAYGLAARQRLAALGSTRGANDVWSLHRRRLTCLLEATALVARDHAGAEQLWQELRALEDAQVLDGHAGFRAPADLRLADALRATGVGGPGAVSARLEAALQRAHHIQDYRFCARITARCNALIRWHGVALTGAALAALVARFAAAPADDEFAPEHVVGEQFNRRTESEQMLRIDEARRADTLERLADVFQRPAVEFLRLNEGLTLTRGLPAGTAVRVPDPGFTPLLAVHLAARVLADRQLDLQRAALIRALVPPAAASPTSLDSVLAYLVIAADPEDPAVLDELVARLGGPVPGDVPPPPAGTVTMIPA